MEENNKTGATVPAGDDQGNMVICSVLFMDIVGYSKLSGMEQIAVKKRFNEMLTAALKDAQPEGMIILDTGDGAAVSFLSDVEGPIKAALHFRDSMNSEKEKMDMPLDVRMGINLGPGHVTKDINGRDNIVGDVINVAQRVMSFCNVGQILVSRSYHDAVSRLSPEYMEMFKHHGMHADKHVRAHEVFMVPAEQDEAESAVAPSPEAAVETAGPVKEKGGIVSKIFAPFAWFFRLLKTIFGVAFGIVRVVFLILLIMVAVNVVIKYGPVAVEYVAKMFSKVSDVATQQVDKELKNVLDSPKSDKQQDSGSKNKAKPAADGTGK